MDITGLLDLREGSFYLIIASLVPLPLLAISETGSTIGSIILIIIGIINLVFVALGLSDYWNGFNKLKGGFKQANIGKIGSLLSIFGITFILGIAFYFLGKAIRNNKVKIGGILYIIALPLLILLYNILYMLSPVWILVLSFTSPLFYNILFYNIFSIILLAGNVLSYLGLTEAAKKIRLIK